jgi:hypothetical protein
MLADLCTAAGYSSRHRRSAGNCSHTVNDSRNIVGIEAYTPTDNVSELTARNEEAIFELRSRQRRTRTRFGIPSHRWT